MVFGDCWQYGMPFHLYMITGQEHLSMYMLWLKTEIWLISLLTIYSQH